MPWSLLYRFQYWKKSWGNHKKVQRKKNVFAQKYDEIRSFDGIILLSRDIVVFRGPPREHILDVKASTFNVFRTAFLEKFVLSQKQ